MSNPSDNQTTLLPTWRWWRRTVPIYVLAAAGAAVAFVAGAWVWSLL